MTDGTISLKKLVNLQDWNKLQESFSEALGLPISTVDPKGEIISPLTGKNNLCSKINSNCQFAIEKCLIASNYNALSDISDLTTLKCSKSLDATIIPIKPFRNKTVGYMVVGPYIAVKHKDTAQYDQFLKDTGLKSEYLTEGNNKCGAFSHTKIHTIAKLLEKTFNDIAQTSYHKKRLGEIASEMVEMDPFFARQYEERLFSALLRTCLSALDADSGSVMKLDKHSDILRIKVASKLDQNIIDHTSVRVGEGIAGRAAQSAETIILPQDEKKLDMQGELKRKYIKSALIVPFNKLNDHDVYGVLNLNIIRKEKAFTENDIKFIKELTNLASIALTPVK